MNQYIEGTLYTPGNHILLVNPRLSRLGRYRRDTILNKGCLH